MKSNDQRVIDFSCCELNRTIFCNWPSEYMALQFPNTKNKQNEVISGSVTR